MHTQKSHIYKKLFAVLFLLAFASLKDDMMYRQKMIVKQVLHITFLLLHVPGEFSQLNCTIVKIDDHLLLNPLYSWTRKTNVKEACILA